MREVVFVKNNTDRWKSFDKMLASPQSVHPDEMADLFVQITDDLAYARTFYPHSGATKYLNSLALKAHRQLYRNKKESSGRIRSFWTTEFPLLIKRTRKFQLYAALFFIIAVCIGVISAANDERFVREILGDHYVNMTIENIKAGEPMRVYSDTDGWEMFLRITFNNMRVMFYAYVLGSLLSYGTIIILVRNGIMLGSFQYFFYQYDVLYESVLSIWIHGTIEIFSIVMGGAAGLMLGNNILFPKTFSRKQSFRQGALDGLKMAMGLAPFIVIAGFLESFVTRYSHHPASIRIGIILASLSLIVWYFFIYPEKVYKQQMQEINKLIDA